MTKDITPRLVMDDERIDEFGRYFFCTTVEMLHQILLNCRVTDTAQRRDVCTIFADNLATFLDVGWIQNKSQKLWPILAFAERVDHSQETIGHLDTLIIPSCESFHGEGGAECAIARHFDKDEEALKALMFQAEPRA